MSLETISVHVSVLHVSILGNNIFGYINLQKYFVRLSEQEIFFYGQVFERLTLLPRWNYN